MAKAERTRQFILEKVAPVFNTRGYAGTSLLDLTEATGLTKGSLYGNFENKEEIAIAVFQYSMDKVREVIGQRLARATTNKEKLTALLDFYAEYVFDPPVPGGCPLLNNAVQADDNEAFLKKYVADDINRTIAFIATLLASGKKAGEFQPHIRAKELAYSFFCSVEGGIMVSRVSGSDAAMKATVRFCKEKLDQIST